MIKLAEVAKIAGRTREFLVELQEDTGVWGEGLCGACGIGAFINWALLKQQHPDLSPSFRMGEGAVYHCWTQFKMGGDRWVIDVTATQFGEETEIIIEPLRQYEMRACIDEFYTEVFSHDVALRKYSQWSGDESVTYFRKEIMQRFPTVHPGLMHDTYRRAV